jgi:hypothetical protein
LTHFLTEHGLTCTRAPTSDDVSSCSGSISPSVTILTIYIIYLIRVNGKYCAHGIAQALHGPNSPFGVDPL